MLTENRALTVEEQKEIAPVIERLNVTDIENIVRFVDTKLEKTYDVYRIKQNDKPLIIKKLEERRFDKAKYDTYFAGKGFAVPKIYETVTVEENAYVLMELLEGIDARNCSEKAAATIGTELAKIQRHYLANGGYMESTEYYWNRYLEKYYEKTKEYFADFDVVWNKAKNRFFEAPITFVHDDFLPINALVGEEQVWIIDWEIAGMYPYFIDLARFSYVYCMDEFFISKEAAKAFLDAYYEGMRQNKDFSISREIFDQDVAISAFYQYVSFIDSEKPIEEVQETMDYKILCKIIEALR